MHEAALERALSLAGDDSAAAVALMAETVRDARERAGEQSAAHAAALFATARLWVELGELERAAASMRGACVIETTGEEAERERLTWVMNLGELLLHLGELAEAEQLLRDGLHARVALYGEAHPGTAFGLLALGEALRALGQLEEAMVAADQAVAIFTGAEHPRLAPALALRAAIVASVGGEPFTAADGLIAGLPETAFDQLVQATLEREGQEPPATFLSLLLGIEAQVRRRRGEHDPWLVSLNGTKAEVARALGAHQIRIEALEYLAGLVALLDDAGQSASILRGLALAHDEAGEPAAAERVYGEALAAARRAGDAVLLADLLRSCGAFHGQRRGRAEAEPLLREAVEVAVAAGASVTAARARVELGLLLQHAGEGESARVLLDSAAAALAAGDPDARRAERHLRAIRVDGPCGCGELSEVLGETVRQLMEPHLPSGLLAGVTVNLEEGEAGVRVELQREPTAEERPLLEALLEQARRKLVADEDLSRD